MTPFTLVNSLFDKDYQDDLAAYVPFVINRALGQQQDTIFFANEMNLHPGIDTRWQYDYFYCSIRTKQRRGQWFKANDSDDLKAVQTYFGMSPKKAREALSILDKELLKEIKKKLE